METLTINRLDGLMSSPILKKISSEQPSFSVSDYFSNLREEVWSNSGNINSTQMTIQEKYIFNLVALICSKNKSCEKIIDGVINEIKTITEIVMDGLFGENSEHYSYLLNLIDDIKHPKLDDVSSF